MERHRERMEIALCGGKPWGFSIKGGTPNNKPITVSKLEPRGKGEASGLRIGDVITCVNDVVLSGIRREAVELIRRAGDRLMLAVERAFPMNTIAMSKQGRPPPPPFESSVDPRIRDPGPPPPFHQMGNFHSTDQQMGWYNERNLPVQNNISMGNSNQPAGYVFSNNGSSNNKIRQQQQVKETLKMVIAEKRDGLVNSPPDVIRDRLSEKSRRSMTSASTVSDPSEKQASQPSHGGVRYRHQGNKDVERPRSWHASKHPEIEQDLKTAVFSSGDREFQEQPVPRIRRKSREWLESGDLRSTLDRNSSESLLSSSSEQLLTENGETPPPQPPPRNNHRPGLSRDRSSINSNPSLLDAFQTPPHGLRSGSFDHDSSLSHRSSQDSLNSSSVSMKSYKMDCSSSVFDSKNNVRFEPSVGNKFRSSGKYGEIWKMPQVQHRRARSYDALSDDSTPRQDDKVSRGRKSTGSSHAELRTHKSPNSPIKSSSEISESLRHKSPGGKSEDVSVKSPTNKSENLVLKSPGIKYDSVSSKSSTIRSEKPLTSPGIKSDGESVKSPTGRTQNFPLKSSGKKYDGVAAKLLALRNEKLLTSLVIKSDGESVKSPTTRTENSPLKSPGMKSEGVSVKSPTIKSEILPLKSPGVKTDGVQLKSPIFRTENLPLKSPGLKAENMSQKSPSTGRSRTEQSRFQFHRAEKGRHVDKLISNFERSSPNEENQPNKITEGRPSSESISIVQRLQQHYASSAQNLSSRQHDKPTEKTQSTGPNNYVQSSTGSIMGLYSGGDDYKTLQSRSDEYRKNIQGMSKKVLRVTSFTRKDLELSPPYQSPVHQPKGFGFPQPPVTKKEGALLSTNGNGPVRSKSTSSLLDTVVPSMATIPVTREETNLLLGKQYCKSLSPPPSIRHVTTSVEKPKEPDVRHEGVVDNIGGRVIKRITGPRNNGLTKVPEPHCEEKNNENKPPPKTFINHTNIQLKSPPPQRRELSQHPHDVKSIPTTPVKIPDVPITPVAADHPADAKIFPPPPIVKPSSPTTLPTQAGTTPLTSDALVETTAPTNSSVTSSSYSELLTSSSPLPATSAYYQTSASKGKIIHLIQEKFEGGEIIDLENNETEEDRNKKKIELLKRITKKLAALQTMKDTIKAEVNENEHLGKTVKQKAEKLCTPRELERFKTFVEEIEKIFNLIFSISGRLARVKNTLATLTEEADTEEKNGLLEKKRKLTSQHEEAILLKENVDRRQETVSKILETHMSAEEYADFEHYIKMKTSLISDQRDVDDKIKLGEEQMRELHDSLPEDLQEEYPLSEQYQAFLTPQSGQGEERRGSDQPSN